MRNLALLLIVAMTVVQCTAVSGGLGLSCNSPWYSHLTYIFAHDGWVHLCINAYALLTLVFMNDAGWAKMAASWVISVLVPYNGDTPLLGMSTLIYALLGITVMDSPRWKMLLTVNISVILSSIFIPYVAFMQHLVCFASGVVIGFLTSERHGRDS